MSNRMSGVPNYRCKKTGRRKYACVSLPNGVGGRHDVLLGEYGTNRSWAEYARVIAEWEAAGRRLPQKHCAKDITVNELLSAYWDHATLHYRHGDGTPTRELEDVKLSLRPLKELYGFTPASQFGPLALKAIRDRLIHQPITRKIKTTDSRTGEATWTQKSIRVGLARGVINQRIGRIRRAFKWAVENEMIPATVYQSLAAVSGLQRGRSKARETAPVRPVSLALVEDTLPHLSAVIADMIQLQLTTGARSGEICLMRGCDLDTTGQVWLYRPQHHKTAYRGFGRVIPLGPKAQEIVKRYLRANTEAFLFSPSETMNAVREKQRQERKSKVQPSQRDRKKKRPKRVPGERYFPSVVAHAVRRACDKNTLPRWHPHQLRHAMATTVRREFGLDSARALLGQHAPQVTELYAELDMQKAVDVARKLG